MACIASAPDVAHTLYELLAASEYNRELNRLINLLDTLRERLAAFAEMDPAPGLVDGLVAIGFDRTTAVAEVIDYLPTPDEFPSPRHAARSLTWLAEVAAAELRLDALPIPKRRR
jgi:hypothetical protein